MAGAIWAIAEAPDGAPTRLSRELATLAWKLGQAAGRPAQTIVAGPGALATAQGLAIYGPDVLTAEVDPGDRPVAAVVAERVAALVEQRTPAYLLLGASNDGRDVAGILQALLGWSVLANTSAVQWVDGGPRAEMSVFGGRLVTESRFAGDHGLVIVRPGSVAVEAVPQPGSVEAVEVAPAVALPEVRIVDRVAEVSAAVSIEEASAIVAGGRGVGGPEGFGVVRELADALGAAVGATRAVVDAGWIPYAHQIGQTGKTVKPQLYIAAGISGAIQHKVGMQTSGTIVAIDRDPDAPIAEFADLMVVGDLFEILPRVSAAVRARRG
ncbi:MAG: electron transfer flavoprotein subunit alpha/FixB family protein [Candidatus Limnocylindrales bacterium]